MKELALTPLMLTVVRESRKMSQTALAKAAGASQSTVSQVEAGLFAPSTALVTRLAEALSCPPSLFRLPLGFRQLPLTFFRKKARVGVKDVRAIRARVNLYRLRSEILLRSCDDVSARLILVDAQSEGLSPAEAAQRLRMYWNVPPGPIDDLTKLVELYGILVIPMDFEHAAVDGLSLHEPNDTLPPMIFLDPSVPGDRWRLSLAHELGHIVLHHHLSIPLPAAELEREAFDFAAEFLVPAREVSGQLHRISLHRLAALKVHWRVSMASLLMRAVRMGRVSDRQSRRLWIRLRSMGKQEPVEVPKERPTRLRRMVLHHLNELGYTASSLSETLHIRTNELLADFDIGPSHLRLV